jgi:hypothetical protein
VLCGHPLAWSRENEEFQRRGSQYAGVQQTMPLRDDIDWNEGSIKKGDSVKYVSRRSGGQFPMLNKFWFYLGHSGLHSGGNVLAKVLAKMLDVVQGLSCLSVVVAHIESHEY